MSKYGVEAFSDALRREMHPWGVKVSMLEPGFFATNIAAPDFLESELRRGWNRLSEDLKNDYGEEFLEKGMGIPCWCISTVVVLCLLFLQPILRGFVNDADQPCSFI